MCADNSVVELPEYIEVLRLAKAEHTLVGKVALARMPRLVQSLTCADGYVDIQLNFGKDVEGHYCISGQMNTDLPLICQRCMLPMQFAVNDNFMLTPVRSDVEAKKLPDHLEPVLLPESERLSLAELIEDELILQLPVVAKHAEAVCSVKILPVEPSSVVIKKDKPNPFATLVALKKQ